MDLQQKTLFNLDTQSLSLFSLYQQELLSYQTFFITKRNPNKQIEDLINEGILSCSLLLKHISDKTPIVDIGSGAGFPGLILGILSKNKRPITLIEPSKKRSEFLNHCIDILKLQKTVSVKSQSFRKTKAPLFTFKAFASLQQTLKLLKKYTTLTSVSYHFKSTSYIEEWKTLSLKEKQNWKLQEIASYSFNHKNRYIIKMSRS